MKTIGINSDKKRWIDYLEEEDASFLKRFILASGSLKEMAAAYGVTYPTVRLRLDRLIAKIRIFDSQETMDDFERLLRAQLADGKLDASTFKVLLTAYQHPQPHATLPLSAVAHETTASSSAA
jgi:hypothetical protein